MAVKANISIDQGTDFDATIDLANSAGEPIDLTGYTIKSQMRKNYASESAAATFQTSNNGVGGQITLVLPKTSYDETTGSPPNEVVTTHPGTTLLEPGRYLYDVEITQPASDGGKTTRVVQGTATVSPGITRI